MKTGLWLAMTAALGLAMASILAGCDSAEGTGGLSISPGSVVLSGSSNNTVAFSAQVSDDLALPLEWSVANTSLGTINYSSGSNAIYIASSSKGNQVVICKDQYGNEGHASVVQQ